MRKHRRLMLILGVLLTLSMLLVASGCAQPEAEEPAEEPGGDGGETGEPEGPVHLRFASHVIGGTAYTQAAVVAQAVRPELPAGSTIDVLPYSGGIGNITLIENGEADLGINISVSDNWAVNGKAIFDKKFTKLRSIAGGTDTFYLSCFITEASGISSLAEAIEQQKPIRLMTLTKGSTGEVATQHLLEALGASFEDIKSWGGTVTHTGFANIKAALKDGRADMMVHGVGLGHPSMTEIALTVDGHFSPLPDEARNYMAETYGYDVAELPAGTFNGQDAAVPTVCYYLTVSCSSDLPDDVAYLIASVLHDKHEDLIAGHASFQTFNPEEGWKPGKAGAPLHPGAEKYYRDQGWMQ